ncbi:hypothetical protein [Comamonas sp. JC664]|uniref:hypothetical protein n=1 Tax=Comamonas sp. JC664 TaxID=2801917 RepID=UPI00361211EF
MDTQDDRKFASHVRSCKSFWRALRQSITWWNGIVMNLQEAFAQLGLPIDADERAVRRAYARQLKDIDQLAQPEAFMHCAVLYEQAMAYARSNAALDHPDAEPDKTEPQQPPLEPLQSLQSLDLRDVASQLGIQSSMSTAVLTQALEPIRSRTLSQNHSQSQSCW